MQSTTAVIAGAVISLVRSHYSGRCSCGCDQCSGCCEKVIDIEEKEH